jgi:hypothetical protein
LVTTNNGYVLTYFYTISYDETKDDFYGVVDVVNNGKYITLFTIDDTNEMCDLIRTGVMKHIDDVIGLKGFLEAQDILGKEDSLTLIETTLY